MQPPRILPLLMSVLAMPISLSAARLAGVSGMVIIMAEDLAKFSELHFIIAAEAGVKANVESMAAAISILISDLPWEKTSEVLAIGIRILYPVRFRKKTFLCAALQRTSPARSGPIADYSIATLEHPHYCGFGRAAMLPVAISGSHDALPRPWA